MKLAAGSVFRTCLLSVVVLLFMEQILLCSILRLAVKQKMGIDVCVNEIRINPLRYRMTLKGVRILNPPHFTERILADIPLIVIDFKKETFDGQGVFLKDLFVHLRELNIIRRKDNEVNLDTFRLLVPPEDMDTDQLFVTDKYRIKISKVNYINHAHRKGSRVQEFDINTNEEYRKLKDLEGVVRICVLKIFFNGKVGNIGIDIEKIRKKLAVLVRQEEENDPVRIAWNRIERSQEVAENGLDQGRKWLNEKIDSMKINAGRIKDDIERKAVASSVFLEEQFPSYSR